jgi:hypothetical protein|tara:strand:+ start:102 stop:326 length:225 start_codon:yes stop_codon:yes gene_type:complete
MMKHLLLLRPLPAISTSAQRFLLQVPTQPKSPTDQRVSLPLLLWLMSLSLLMRSWREVLAHGLLHAELSQPVHF